MSEIIAHPETGKPVRRVESFVEVDALQLQQAVSNDQATLTTAKSELAAAKAVVEDKEDAVTKAEAALENSKSELDQHNSIAPEATPEVTGANSTLSSDGSTEDSVGSGSGSEGDSRDGVTAVPVEVKDDLDEY